MIYASPVVSLPRRGGGSNPAPTINDNIKENKMDRTRSTKYKKLMRVLEFANANGFPHAQIDVCVNSNDGVYGDDLVDCIRCSDELEPISLHLNLREVIYGTVIYDEKTDEFVEHIYDEKPAII